MRRKQDVLSRLLHLHVNHPNVHTINKALNSNLIVIPTNMQNETSKLTAQKAIIAKAPLNMVLENKVSRWHLKHIFIPE